MPSARTLIATALGNGNGTFQAIRTETGSSVLENLRISDDLEAGDLDGDGTPDLLVFNYASNDVSVFIVNPDGSLRPHQRYGIGNTPILGTLADFDGDGRLDVAAAIGLPPSGLHNAIVLLRNIGAGHADADTFSECHGNSKLNSDSNTEFYPHGNSDAHCDRNSHSDGISHGHSEANADRQAARNTQAQANTTSSALNNKKKPNESDLLTSAS